MCDHRGRRAGLARFAAWALILAAANPSGAVVVNRILATVGDSPITLYELKTFSRTNPLAAQGGQSDPAAVLDTLITTRLIQIEVEKKGIVIGEPEIENYLEQITRQNQITRDQLFAALREQGLDPDAYRLQIRQELERAQLINREIRNKVNVTPEDVQRYYDAHLADYEKSPQVTVSHIMLRLTPNAPAGEVERVEGKAEEIHALLDRGKDFGELASQYSEDPAAETGGSLGTFRAGTLLDALNDAIKDLDVGEYSEPVRSDVGIHIVRLDDRSAESHTPVDELADEIRERLYNEALEERYVRWLKEDLRERHHVEMLE